MRYLKRNKTKIFILLLLTLLIRAIIGYFSKSVEAYAILQTQNFSEQIIIDCINDNILTSLDDESFFTPKYNTTGVLSSYYLNTHKINKIRNEVSSYTDEIVEHIDVYGFNNNISVPLAYFFGLKTLFNIDVDIPVCVEAIGNQSVEIKRKCLTEGINSLLVEFYLYISIDMRVVLPFKVLPFTTDVEIPLAYEIINNEIPYYYSVSK